MRDAKLILALIGALAACSPSTNEANDADSAITGTAAVGAADNAVIETLPPDDEPSTGDLDVAEGNLSSRDEDQVAGMPLPPSPPAATGTIPTQYRGRWGMVPADCTSTRGDAKGLMTVGSNSIRFYESLASLQEQRPAVATSFSGVYSFEGEGRSWERVITLTRTGNVLKRAQADGSFTYTRCP